MKHLNYFLIKRHKGRIIHLSLPLIIGLNEAYHYETLMLHLSQLKMAPYNLKIGENHIRSNFLKECYLSEIKIVQLL